jgi:hypothetical protein
MEVVQMKKGGKVKRRRAKQPTQTQRQVVNINMGGGGRGGATIGSTHTFSQQPPQFYNAIREVPNQPVNYGNNPFKVSVGVGTSIGEATVPEGRAPVPNPNAPLSMRSNPDPYAPKMIPQTPPRGRGRGQPKLSLPMTFVPRRAMPEITPASSSASAEHHTDDVRPPASLAFAEPHDENRLTIGDSGLSPQASSSVDAGAMMAQLPRRGRPPKEAGAPTAPYNKSEGYIPPKYRPTPSGMTMTP